MTACVLRISDWSSDVCSSCLAMLDAPVSGGPKGAREGTLSFMVGGDLEAFADAEPVLRAMGHAIFHAGHSGAGQVAKICNNMLAAILMAGTDRKSTRLNSSH